MQTLTETDTKKLNLISGKAFLAQLSKSEGGGIEEEKVCSDSQIGKREIERGGALMVCYDTQKHHPGSRPPEERIWCRAPAGLPLPSPYAPRSLVVEPPLLRAPVVEPPLLRGPVVEVAVEYLYGVVYPKLGYYGEEKSN
ncbi:hypothetical protein ACP4OV_016567 [Aristida adscensionis]